MFQKRVCSGQLLTHELDVCSIDMGNREVSIINKGSLKIYFCIAGESDDEQKQVFVYDHLWLNIQQT